MVMVTEDWVPKELTVVARKGSGATSDQKFPSESSLEPLRTRIDWLNAVVTTASELSALSPLGLFGTSIAATWLFDELKGQVDFFVDEDPNRAGRKYMDRPVHVPGDVPAGSRVFLALPPDFAASVKARLEKNPVDCELVLPPAFSVHAAPARTSGKDLVD